MCNSTELKTKVLFRKTKLCHEIIAVFPEIPGTNNYNTCLCYARLGQHFSSDTEYLVNDTIPLKNIPDSLYNELKDLGYDLQVIKRFSYVHLRKRKKAVIKIDRS